MSRIGTLQGTYLGVYPGKVCEYWTRDVKDNCKFCSVGLNLGARRRRREERRRGPRGRARARGWRAASPTSISTPATTRARPTSTSSSPTSWRSRSRPACWSACRRRRTPTSSATTRSRRWASTASPSASRSSTSERFVEVCPGKHTQYGLDRYLEAVEYCASLGGGDLAYVRALGHQRRDHRRSRARGVEHRRHRLDHREGCGPDGLRVPSADRHGLRGRWPRRRPKRWRRSSRGSGSAAWRRACPSAWPRISTSAW